MLGLIEAGLGVAAVPSMAMPMRDHPILTSVPLVDPVVTRRVGIVTRRGRPLTPAAQQFYQTIIDAKRSGMARAPRQRRPRNDGGKAVQAALRPGAAGHGARHAVGHFWPQAGASLKPLSDAFVALVRMMIAPIVFCTIVTGITSLASGCEDRTHDPEGIGVVLRSHDRCARARARDRLRAASGNGTAHRRASSGHDDPRAVFDAHAVTRIRRIRASCDPGDARRRFREGRGAAGAAARPSVRLRIECEPKRRATGSRNSSTASRTCCSAFSR